MKYSLGLDIGTTSIGWAVIDLDNERIHDVGVRIFEKPEDPQSGKSLAEPRRTARSTRRRLKRRRQRLNTLKAFFVEHRLLTREKIEELLAPNHQYDPYEIRTRAVVEKVSNEELFLALYHIAKRRGYKSNRKSLEEKDTEGSRVLSALSDNAQILASYPSVGTALRHDAKFTDHRRNKRDDYTNSFGRANFLDETKKIIETQQANGLELSNDAIKELLFADEHSGDFSGIFSQRPFMTSELIQKMRGTCELEPSQPRAPRASYSFELFRLAQNLSHLRIVISGETRALTPDEIAQIVEKAKNIKTLKYTHIREVLGYKNNPDFSFARGMIRGKVKPEDKTNGEANKFDELTFYHAVKSALKDSPADWSRGESNPELLDTIGEILTINKDDINLQKALAEIELSPESIANLLRLNFSGFGHLSLRALHNITPHLLDGKNYDEAVVAAGYRFSQTLSGDKTKLPPLNEQQSQQLTNPIVKRAVSQTIKVVNAIIRKYGMPTRIGIEAAGDLSKNFQERGKIKKSQDENAATNEKIIDRLKNEFGVATPTGLQITKFKLYNQQNGECMYSGKQLNLNQLFADERYGEIDHIIPFSRCGNDGLVNKVLVLTEENQNKGNLTPYEAWGHDEAKWAEYEARVKATFLPFGKKDRLLTKSPPAEEWNERALNDTRYISKFLRRYFRENLKPTREEDDKGKQWVITPSGPITSYLRKRWQVGSKSRKENNLHHATDACIVACVNQGAIQKISSLNKYYELFPKGGVETDEVVDKLTGQYVHRGDLEQHIVDTLPWEDFGKEVRLRTGTERNKPYATPTELHEALIGLGNYDDGFRLSVKPIFVSRMPKRGGKGSTNQETIRSPKVVEGYENDKGGNVIARKQRVALSSLKLKDLEDSPLKDEYNRTKSKDSSGMKSLYEILKQRLEDNGDDPKKAFAEPVYKPTKTGEQGNIVRSVKVYDTLKSKTGFYINDGKAFVNNGSTIRLDVYKRKNFKGEHEYYFAPVYTHLIHADKVEILPTPTGRSNDDKSDLNTIREADGKIYATVENGFEKQFSIYPNDYVRIYMGNKIVEGYYSKYDIVNAVFSLVAHSSSDKSTFIKASPRTAVDIQRLDISVLGDNYKWI
ncbi:MAG TPA: type II CRISPR RNA-guided endonuclease Cas9 [Candidatus Saccharibacteria bacterium]|nr:type II CRISPR RNA-guided endonuclease Cas9 [Candidatus Saccharibacteria bacterium]HMR38040.1 type II CRISPR RNA-guided endonuclease Cas9 [Candidatus Saccharibacteria bacterium]